MQTENTKELTAEQEISMIAGRIIDEYRKHSHSISDWNLIAAKKLHSNWSEYYNAKLQQANKEIEERKSIAEDYRIMVRELQSQLKAKDEMLEKMADGIKKYKHISTELNKLFNQYNQSK